MMANILFVVVENLRQYGRSPLIEESVLHLVYASEHQRRGGLAHYPLSGGAPIA